MQIESDALIHKIQIRLDELTQEMLDIPEHKRDHSSRATEINAEIETLDWVLVEIEKLKGSLVKHE